jgi:monoamine oxidase
VLRCASAWRLPIYVIKLVLRFKTRWWINAKEKDLSELWFLLSDATIPVWWTQRPTEDPVLTGWVAGPKTKRMAYLAENKLVETGLASLVHIFELSPKHLTRDPLAARAIDWAKDPFAGGAYSYATPATRNAQLRLARPEGGVVFFFWRSAVQRA